MQSIIDTPYNVGPYADRLADEGVKTVIRYYNNRNSSRFPNKCLTPKEASQLNEAGLSISCVFQQRGGAGGHLSDFSTAKGKRDAKSALRHAASVNQPNGSAIYFGVDWDFYRTSELTPIISYFRAVNDTIGSKFKIGVYGSGTVCQKLRSERLAELFWLPKSTGWSGSRSFYQAGDWTLFQHAQDIRSPWGKFDYDGNQFNPAFENFGAWNALDNSSDTFEPQAEPAVISTYQIIARSGLNLRRGPGTEYPSEYAIAANSIVFGLGKKDGWLLVDVTGDGQADGYMKSSFLKLLSGGILSQSQSGATPYQVAQIELARGVSEVSGSQHNPRIVLYHSTTKGGSAPDETAWCSSFVNFCVEQSGQVGTNSKWARSWHDGDWGADVSGDPQEGAIVVFSRKNANTNGGHVGFLVEDLGDYVKILGGNQSNRVRVQTYPKNGKLGSFKYELLSYRN